MQCTIILSDSDRYSLRVLRQAAWGLTTTFGISFAVPSNVMGLPPSLCCRCPVTATEGCWMDSFSPLLQTVLQAAKRPHHPQDMFSVGDFEKDQHDQRAVATGCSLVADRPHRPSQRGGHRGHARMRAQLAEGTLNISTSLKGCTYLVDSLGRVSSSSGLRKRQGELCDSSA